MKAIRGYHSHKESSLLNLNARNFYNFLSNKLRSRKPIPVMHDDERKFSFTDNEKITGFSSEFKKVFTLGDDVLPFFRSYTNLCCDLNETNLQLMLYSNIYVNVIVNLQLALMDFLEFSGMI